MQPPTKPRLESHAIEHETRTFLRGRLGPIELADTDNIFASGFVNSMFALQLVCFVERTFGVTIENDDLELSNFNSVAAISRFVRSKQST